MGEERAVKLTASTREAEWSVSAAKWKMAVCRVSTPPIPEVSCPVAENWCYTQVGDKQCYTRVGEKLCYMQVDENWCYTQVGENTHWVKQKNCCYKQAGELFCYTHR